MIMCCLFVFVGVFYFAKSRNRNNRNCFVYVSFIWFLVIIHLFIFNIYFVIYLSKRMVRKSKCGASLGHLKCFNRGLTLPMLMLLSPKAHGCIKIENPRNPVMLVFIGVPRCQGFIYF